MPHDVLKIKNMVFYAYHGVKSEEKEKGQRFEVDVELILDLSKAAQSDSLSQSIDCNLVYEIVEDVVIEGEFNLVETVAEHIARALLTKLRVEEVVVRVRKPHAPLRGISDGIEVEIVRSL